MSNLVPNSIPTAKSAKVTLQSTGHDVTLYYDPFLRLFVISDCSNLGPHLVRVTVDTRGLYQTDYLLGGDDKDIILPIARYLAPFIINPVECNGHLDPGQDLNPHPNTELLMSISLRQHDPNVVRELAGFIKDSPSLLQPVAAVTLSSWLSKCFMKEYGLCVKTDDDELNCRVLERTAWKRRK